VLPVGTAGRFVRFAAGQLWSHLRHAPRSEVSGELRRVIGEQRTARSLALLGMGRNRADGVMTLRDDWLAIDWSMRSSASYYRRVRQAMKAYADALGGRFSDNTLARLHRVVAAHPLGGCPMGDTRHNGVVDAYGRVYGYEHLVIADGSVLPSAAGANPSLTIAALADRFAEQLAEDLV
jgi:cholesterol oxidase